MRQLAANARVPVAVRLLANCYTPFTFTFNAANVTGAIEAFTFRESSGENVVSGASCAISVL